MDRSPPRRGAERAPACLALVFCAASFLIPPAPASSAGEKRWEFVVSAADQRYFIDRATLERRGGIVLFWEKILSDPPLDAGGVKVDESQQLVQADCQRRLYRLVQQNFYFRDALLGAHTPPDQEWKGVPSRTPVQSAVDRACALAGSEGG